MTPARMLRHAPRARVAYARYVRETRRLAWLDVAIGALAFVLAASIGLLLPLALWILETFPWQ